MTGSRLAISLCLTTLTISAVANDNGYQKPAPKARKVGLKTGFGKATTSAPDPSLSQLEPEPVQPQAQIEMIPAAVAAPISSQIPPTPDDGGTPPPRPNTSEMAPATPAAQPAAVAPKPAISFVAPRPITTFSEGCTDPQCQTCQPQSMVQPSPANQVCQPCQTAQVQQACPSCSAAAPCATCSQGQQRQSRWRLFRKRQRRPRMNRRKSVSTKRRQWWPWLATNDMPVPQNCGCPACSGVPAAGCTTNLTEPVSQPANAFAEHEFKMLEEFSAAAPTSPAAKRTEQPAEVLSEEDFAPLEPIAPNRLNRVARRISQTRTFSDSKRQLSGRTKATQVLRNNIGVWQSK